MKRLWRWGRALVRENWLAVSLLSLATVIYVAFELLDNWHFHFAIWDLGMYNRHLWGVVRGDFGINPLKGYNLLGDHGHYLLILLTPLYAIWQRPESLLVVQALALALSGWPIYLVAKKNMARPTIAALWLLPYYAYFGTWAALGFPFHVAAMSALPLAWTLYFLLEKKIGPMLVCLTLAILLKEDMATVAVMVGLYVMIIQRRWRLGLAISAVAAGYFELVSRVFLPAVSHLRYYYADTNISIKAAILHPAQLLHAFFQPIEKTKTMVAEMMSFGGFLPLFGLEVFILLTPLWLGRFLTNMDWRWLTNQHYSVNQGPILAIAAIVGVMRLLYILKTSYRWSPRAVVVAQVVAPLFCLLTTMLGYGYVMTNYAAQLWHPSFYKSTAAERSTRTALAMVPKNASIAVQSSIVDATSRREVYQLPFDFPTHQPTYLLLSEQIDKWPFADAAAVRIYAQSAVGQGYHIVFDQAGAILLKHD